MTSIQDRAKHLIHIHLAQPLTVVTDDASLIDDLGADSLDAVELVMVFEEEFGIEIPDDQAEKILTVGDAVAYIEDAKTGEAA